MTLLDRWLNQLVDWCDCGQKNHAWKVALRMAEVCPHELSELPDMLKAEMLARKSNAQQTGS
jgi:hypothetical protein